MPDSQNTLVRWLRPDEDDEWDTFVAAHRYGLVYHRACWRRLLEEAFPHIRGRFLGVFNTTTGHLVAGLPVYAVKSWLLGNRIVSLPYASVCDPLVTDAEHLQKLWPYVQDIYGEVRAKRIEIRSRNMSKALVRSLSRGPVYKHHFLVLDKEPQELFRSFAKSSVCQKITKATKLGVSVNEAQSSRDMNVCYEILAQTRRRLSLPPMPRSFFAAMHRNLWPRHLKMFLALSNGKPIGCHIVLISGNVWISEYSGNTDDAVHGANQLLYWETILRAKHAGAKVFSFGRTASSNDGLLAYKRRWATVEEDVVSFVFPPPIESAHGGDRERSIPYRVLKLIVANAPMPACEMLGRFCYRHLG